MVIINMEIGRLLLRIYIIKLPLSYNICLIYASFILVPFLHEGGKRGSCEKYSLIVFFSYYFSKWAVTARHKQLKSLYKMILVNIGMACTVKITHPLFLHPSLYLHMGPFPYNPITLSVLCISVMSVRPHPLRWSFKLINLISNTIWTCPRGWKHHKGWLSLHLSMFL